MAELITTSELEIGREYYWKRTKGWTWIDGTHCWWEIFVVPLGINGVMDYWVTERWRWNGSSQTIREQTRSLSWDESRELER